MRPKILLAMILLFANCAGDPYKDYKDKFYTLQFGDTEWVSIPPERSDEAFQSNTTGTIITLTSFCRKFQNSPLEILAKRALSGIHNLKILSQEVMNYSGREAYTMEASGSLDGVEVGVKILNFRKNNCYYDVFLLSPQSPVGSMDQTAFSKFLSSLKVDP